MKRMHWATPFIGLTCGLLWACNSTKNHHQSSGAGSGSASHVGDGSGGKANSSGALTVAGSGGGGSIGAAGYDGADAAAGAPASIASCEDLGAQACARLAECAPYYVDSYYADQDTCRSLFSSVCSDLAKGPMGVSFERCAESLSSCTAIMEQRGIPAWCWQPQGAVPLGGKCAVDTDCEAGLCQREKSATAGTCSAAAKVGEGCEPPARCAIGLRCGEPDHVCIVPAADGQKCKSSFDCLPGSSCGESERCAPSKVGDPCISGLAPCTPAQTCLLDQCAELQNADDTHSCVNGFQCSGKQRCAVQQTEQLERTGECRDAATAGATCDAQTPCLEPLTCRSGKCTP